MTTKSYTFSNDEGVTVKDGKAVYHSMLEVEISQDDAYDLALELLNKIRVQSRKDGDRKISFLLTGKMESEEDDFPARFMLTEPFNPIEDDKVTE